MLHLLHLTDNQGDEDVDINKAVTDYVAPLDHGPDIHGFVLGAWCNASEPQEDKETSVTKEGTTVITHKKLQLHFPPLSLVRTVFSLHVA